MTNRGLKFLIAGAFNTGINYLLFVLLVYLGLNYNIALTVDYIFGIGLGYLINRYWTFSAPGSNQKNLRKYIALYLLVFLLNALILNALIMLHIVRPIMGQLIALGIVTLLSFQLQNKWVFAAKK